MISGCLSLRYGRPVVVDIDTASSVYGSSIQDRMFFCVACPVLKFNFIVSICKLYSLGRNHNLLWEVSVVAKIIARVHLCTPDRLFDITAIIKLKELYNACAHSWRGIESRGGCLKKKRYR